MSRWIALIAMFSSIRWTGTCSAANGRATTFALELTNKRTKLGNLTLRETIVAFDLNFINCSSF
jgi:hypothetical protein